MATSSYINRAAWQHQPKGPFTVRDTDLWAPGPNEIRIKIHAAAVQQAEGKIATLAILPLTYPAILGSTCAGIVDALGPNVTKVAVGERVTAGLDNYANRGDPARASHQRFAIANVAEVVPIGEELGFGDAVAANSQTPANALFKFLGMEYPVKEGKVVDRGQSVLIWGGSGAMGYLSVRYAKLAGYRVLTTASKRSFDLVKGAGADVVLDRGDAGIVEQLKEEKIDFWFDTISLPDTIGSMLKVAEAQRQRTGKDIKIVTLLPATGDSYPKAPEGITLQMMLFRSKLEENRAHIEWLMGKGGFLETGLKNGSIRGVPAEVVGGLDAVPKAVDQINAGVSGKKLIIDPWL